MLMREARVAGRAGGGRVLDADRVAAFGRLTDRYLVPSYRLASLLLGSEVEAEDAIQDAAVIAWERFETLRDHDRFGAWFQRILVNGCRDRLRQRRRIRTVSLDDVSEPEAAESGSGLVERDALRRAIDGLTVDQRTVIVLRYFADLSLEEIAQQTSERLGTVKSRLHYALQVLHAAYEAADRLPGGTAR